MKARAAARHIAVRKEVAACTCVLWHQVVKAPIHRLPPLASTPAVENLSELLASAERHSRFGSWLLALGSWLLALGSWLLALGSWPLALGLWPLAFGFWLLAFDVGSPMSRAGGRRNSPQGGRQDAGQWIVRAGSPVDPPRLPPATPQGRGIGVAFLLHRSASARCEPRGRGRRARPRCRTTPARHGRCLVEGDPPSSRSPPWPRLPPADRSPS